MANPKSFGRRGAAPVAPMRTARISLPDAALRVDDEKPPPATRPRAVDPEFEAWKASRKRAPIPWRPLSLMASLCFAIAPFKLPDDLNDVLQYPLYGLAAMSFYVWWTGRKSARKVPDADSEPVTAP